MKKSTKTSAKANTTATPKRKYTKRSTAKVATSYSTVNKPTVTVAEIISHTKTHIVAKWENKLITVEL
tara:strand:+ start:163 stop:366 length:204 start_codon:yes stop_codon:yes gene_type:complete